MYLVVRKKHDSWKDANESIVSNFKRICSRMDLTNLNFPNYMPSKVSLLSEILGPEPFRSIF